MNADEVRELGDLDGLDKEGLIAFLNGERTDKIALWNAWRKTNERKPVDLTGANLGWAWLEGANLREARLQGANLSGARLEGANLNRALLEGASLRGAWLEGASLSGMWLPGADLSRARLEGADLRGVHLEGANLIETQLKGADLGWARLEGADLGGALLEKTNLIEARLEGADLGGAHLEGANLNGARLEKADLMGAWLEEAQLRGAQLDGVRLYEARLKGADLRRARLRDVELSSIAAGGLEGVKLYQTYFWGVLSLRYEQFLDENRDARGPRGLWLGLWNWRDKSTIWEEKEGHFREAKDVFKTLKGYFEDAGDYEGANWAYVREQLMEKLMHCPRPARWLYPHWRGRWNEDYCEPRRLEWLRLEFAEKIANYGDSLLRPVFWLGVVVVGFAALYLALGASTAMPGCGYADLSVNWQEGCEPTRNLIDNLLFSLGAMTTADVGRVQPYLPNIGFLMTLETLIGIALTGLVGFVLGNKLRYS
jgi:uncharacterized protein YjbI with pentapeptide repeats